MAWKALALWMVRVPPERVSEVSLNGEEQLLSVHSENVGV